MTAIPVEILQGGQMYCSSIDCLVLSGYNIYYPILFILAFIVLISYIIKRWKDAKTNAFRFN